MSVLDTLEICFQANLNGVEEQLESLNHQLDAIGGASLRADEGLRSAGEGLTDGLIRGISQSQTALRTLGSSAARQYAQAVRAQTGQMVSAGGALSEGLAKGIGAKSASVNAAIRKMADSATRLLKSLLKIHSPSKVTEGYGAFFAEGFAKGIRETQAEVLGAVNALESGAVNALNPLPAAQSAEKGESCVRGLENLHLTIPIQVDGMKLGEASIRGINAVTRSTGKLLLNL